MLKNIIIFILLLTSITFLGLYILKPQKESIDIIEQEVENTTQIEETEEVEEWTSFTNNVFSYTIEYPVEWNIDNEVTEQIWVYDQEEKIAILFASETATQTGFPEYEVISSYDSFVDGREANVLILEDQDTRAILSVFESEKHPHFVMMTYHYQSQENDDQMIELNNKFLNKITFQ